MPFVKVYIHLVWCTKNRNPYLDSKELREKVWLHIKENAEQKGIYVDYVSGYTDHCHCLVSLNALQDIQYIVKMLKGESAFWINKNKLTAAHFAWQNEYFAVSVSESMIERVRNYILNQEEHHKKITFAQEYQEFIEVYGFD